MENAHCAEEDAKAVAQVLDGQLEMYADLPRDVAGLGGLCYEIPENYINMEGKFVWVDGEAVCTFSRDNNGRRLKDIAEENPGFLTWILERDFSSEVKEMVNKALHGEFPRVD